MRDQEDEFESLFENEFRSILKKFQPDIDETEKLEKEAESKKIRMNDIF